MPTNVLKFAQNASQANQYFQTQNKPEDGKQNMEILELEMRARAIRAMLENEGGNASDADAFNKPQDTDMRIMNPANMMQPNPVALTTPDSSDMAEKPRSYRRKDLESDSEGWNDESSEEEEEEQSHEALLEKMASIQKELEEEAKKEAEKEQEEPEEGEVDDDGEDDEVQTSNAVKSTDKVFDKKKKHKKRPRRHSRSRRSRSRSKSPVHSKEHSKSPVRTGSKSPSGKSPARETDPKHSELREQYEKLKSKHLGEDSENSQEKTEKINDPQTKEPNAQDEDIVNFSEVPTNLNKEDTMQYKVSLLVKAHSRIETKIESLQASVFKKSADCVEIMEEEIREAHNNVDKLKVHIYQYKVELKKDFEEEVALTGVEDAYIQSQMDTLEETMEKCKKLYESLKTLRDFYDMRKVDIKEEQAKEEEKRKIELEKAEKERIEFEKQERIEKEKKINERLKQDKELAERAELERKRVEAEKKMEEIRKQREEIERKAMEEEEEKKRAEAEKEGTPKTDSDTRDSMEDDKPSRKEEEEEDVLENMSWGSRYYQSDKVQKVVSESKIFSKIRRNKKMKINITKSKSLDEKPAKDSALDEFKKLAGNDTDMRIMHQNPSAGQDEAHTKYLLELQEYYKKMQVYYEQYGKHMRDANNEEQSYEQWVESQQGGGNNDLPPIPEAPKEPWKSKPAPKKTPKDKVKDPVQVVETKSKPETKEPEILTFPPIQPIKATSLPIPPQNVEEKEDKKSHPDHNVVGLIGEEGKKFDHILEKCVDENHEPDDSDEEDLWSKIMGDEDD